MSKYNLIASDIQMPEVDLTNVKRITVKELKKLNPEAKSPLPLDRLDENLEVMYCESEDDMDGLTVSLCDNPPNNLDYHIKKKYVYWLPYRFTEKCSAQLLEYLKKNMLKDQKVEIWSIWIGNKNEIYRVRNIKEIKLSELTEDDLTEISSEKMCICVTG
ncbi:hypothetical protein [Clostridium aciditolerans]|uniref:Uncharacterized protein n=1 Tax=Clostridium aciditolerans TaxID=339861 RepID=A0A934I4J7_9CLOT|nr:hypothetical protein [Clostridium aciditolerans]MBI6874856.1 hypothetical protein [Clostridium aciditolerans]